MCLNYKFHHISSFFLTSLLSSTHWLMWPLWFALVLKYRTKLNNNAGRYFSVIPFFQVILHIQVLNRRPLWHMTNRSLSTDETQIISGPSDFISISCPNTKRSIFRLGAWWLYIKPSNFPLQSLSWLLANIASFPHYIMPHFIFLHPLIHSITAAVLQGKAFRSTCVWQVYTWIPKNTSSVFRGVRGFKRSYQVWLDLQTKKRSDSKKELLRFSPHTCIHFFQNQVPPSSLLITHQVAFIWEFT